MSVSRKYKNLLQVSSKRRRGLQYHTVVEIACRYAFAAKNPSAVLEGIWSDFSGPTPGVMSTDGFEMTYWPLGDATPEILYTAGLVKEKMGRCGAWARLFKDALAVHGISAQVYTINPKVIPPSEHFVYPPPVGYPVEKKRGFYIKTSLAGQGNPTPKNMFENHAVVKVTIASSYI